MGLDMYLEKRTHRYRKPDGTYSTSMEDCTLDKWGVSNGEDITRTVAYWRKANQIHGWFVDNVCGGEDECRPHDVSLEQVTELRDLCVKVLKAIDGTKMTVPDKELENFAKYVNMAKENPEDGASIVETIDYTVNADALIEGDFDNFPSLWYHAMKPKAAKVCKELLPCQKGFFFGSTEYTGNYLYSVVKTVKMLNEVIRGCEGEKYPEFIYQASW